MTTPIKNLIWGVGLAVLINCIYVSSSFTVGKAKLLSSEICLVKAFLQVLVFSLSKSGTQKYFIESLQFLSSHNMEKCFELENRRSLLNRGNP